MSTTTDTEAHQFMGWTKIRSRRGGLMAPRCSCGWQGGATYPSATSTQHQEHQAEMAAQA